MFAKALIQEIVSCRWEFHRTRRSLDEDEQCGSKPLRLIHCNQAVSVAKCAEHQRLAKQAVSHSLEKHSVSADTPHTLR